MKAYVIVRETITDEAKFAEYRAQVLPTVEAFGGEFVIRGGHWTLVEGEWSRPRLVIIAFPSRAKAEDWYHSAAYQKLLPLRLQASQSDLIIADGLA
ncbi:MAG: DUF1330 domain-containing protein [Hyphomicrobiaceae bacterium]|nr:DUF1330 domain-containing protein [Hyphomicrobiaceae bacterium]